MAKSKRALCALLVILPVAGLVRAQVASATLSGTVTDPSSAAISGAAVTATQAATGFSRTTATDAKGSYSFDQLAPGTYTIAARKPGFREYEGESLALERLLRDRPSYGTEVDARHERTISRLVDRPAYGLRYDSLEDGIRLVARLADGEI